MSRLTALASVLVCVAADAAHAQEITDASTAEGVAPGDLSDQAIGGSIGLAGGGRTTAGGFRIAGHYLYRMSEQDWFDGTAQFTFGSGAGACFRDRRDDVICQHGLLDGASAAIGANVRHFLGGRGEFWPYLRGGVGLALVRFGGDDVTGLAIPLHLGAGFRVTVSEGIAVTTEAGIDVGIGRFGNGLGVEPQLGGSVTAGAEFNL